MQLCTMSFLEWQQNKYRTKKMCQQKFENFYEIYKNKNIQIGCDLLHVQLLEESVIPS